MSRDANFETATAVQEKLLEAIRVGQEATLTAVRDAAEAFTTAVPKMPEWVEAMTTAMPKMPEWAGGLTSNLPDVAVLPSFETLIGFTETLWENQREFNLKFYDAIAPFGRSAFGAAKDTAKAANTATPHKKPTAEQAKAAPKV